jgi:hypothetical protein
MFVYSDTVIGLFRQIFIRLTSFRGMPNSIRILHKTALLTESHAYLKSSVIRVHCTYLSAICYVLTLREDYTFLLLSVMAIC